MNEDVVLYNINDLMRLLKVTRVTVLRYINQKKIKAFKVGHSWLVTKEALEEFIRLSEQKHGWET